jgi:hypothetical protein
LASISLALATAALSPTIRSMRKEVSASNSIQPY